MNFIRFSFGRTILCLLSFLPFYLPFYLVGIPHLECIYADIEFSRLHIIENGTVIDTVGCGNEYQGFVPSYYKIKKYPNLPIKWIVRQNGIDYTKDVPFIHSNYNEGLVIAPHHLTCGDSVCVYPITEEFSDVDNLNNVLTCIFIAGGLLGILIIGPPAVLIFGIYQLLFYEPFLLIRRYLKRRASKSPKSSKSSKTTDLKDGNPKVEITIT